jgi:hypothetical protein
VTLARRLAKQIGPDIEQLRWLWWQTVRRYPRYLKDVEALLRHWRGNPSEKTQGLVVRQESGGYKLSAEFFQRQARTRATAAALEGYERLCTRRNCPDLPPNPRAKKRRIKYFLAAVELASIADRALHSRYYTLRERPTSPLPILALLKLKRRKKDALPELKAFSRRWKLKFPIPPSLALPPEELMTSGWCWPVKIQRADRHSLTLILYRPAGKEILLAFIKGALFHSSPKRKPRKGMPVRMASQKRGVKRVVRIVSLPKKRAMVTIALPANAQDVRAALADKLPRSPFRWRDRKVYETVFTVIDSLKTCLPRPVTPSGRSKVWDSQRAFKSLVRIFGLPR